MKSSFFSRAARLTALSALIAFAGCGRETPPAPTGGNAANAGEGLTIEYETLPSILFEAESGLVTAPVALYDDAEASGGKYALAPEGPEHKEISIGGGVTYAIATPESGEYVLWLRAKWSGDCGNSLGITLDGQDLGDVGDAVHEKWHWVRLRRGKLTLAGGVHVLTITNREDGSAWDQVLLARDEDYRPAGIETEDVRGRTLLKDTAPPKKPAVSNAVLPAPEAGARDGDVPALPPAPTAEKVEPVLER